MCEEEREREREREREKGVDIESGRAWWRERVLILLVSVSQTKKTLIVNRFTAESLA